MQGGMAVKQAALAHLQAGRNGEAARLFQGMVAQNPGDAESWYYLGIALTRLGDLGQAADAFGRATRAAPRFGQAFYWLGRVRYYQNRLEEAVDAFRQAIRKGYREASVWNELGKAQEQAEDYPAAEKSFRAAMRQNPRDDAACANLARLLHHQGRLEGVEALYRRALELNPANLKAALGYHLSLPIIYEDRSHLEASRRRYEEGVAWLEREVGRFQGPCTRLNDLLARDGFYLAYQGFDDREVQAGFGRFCHALLGHARPQFMQPVPARPVAGRRIRVGYLCHYFHFHTVSYYFGDWIRQADRDRFEVCVYHLDPVRDEVSKGIRAAADLYRPLGGELSAIAQQLRDDALDILVYPEIGMYPRHMWLATLRLAPVQCAAWGHPVTTGLPNIDFFLSAEATEPPGAEAHYTEQLVRLAGLGVSCAPMSPPGTATRADFGLPRDRRLYLCSQSLFKIHVDMDELFTGIAERDPHALMLFFEDGKPEVDRAFRGRIERVFREAGLDPGRHVRFLERLGHQDYLKLSTLVDVMLDTPHFSGGRTSLDAIACGVPLMTLEGAFSRGRQTAGMLRILGLEEWVARTPEDYVAKALALAGDPERRREVSEQMRTRAPRALFGQLSAVRSLEDFYIYAIR